MANFYDDDGGEYSSEIRNFNSLKTDNELFDEESYIAHTVVTVKRVAPSLEVEKWEILENNKVVLTLKAAKFSEAERRFFRSVEGMKFLVSAHKEGGSSLSILKEKLQQVVK